MEKTSPVAPQEKQPRFRLNSRPLRKALGKTLLATCMLAASGVLTPTPLPEKVMQPYPITIPSSYTVEDEDALPYAGIRDDSQVDMDYLRRMERHYNPFDTKPDPIFRAASVRLAQGETSAGTGGILEKDGHLYMATAGHVARIFIQKELNVYPTRYHGSFYIPRVGTGTILPSRFIFSGQQTFNKDGDKIKPEFDDEYALYPFGERNTKILRQAISEGILTPLSFYEGEIHQGDEVVVQKHFSGDWVRDNVNLLSLRMAGLEISRKNGTSLVNCEGDSGSPVLKISASKVTSQMVGVLSAAILNTAVRDPDTRLALRKCSTTMVSRITPPNSGNIRYMLNS